MKCPICERKPVHIVTSNGYTTYQCKNYGCLMQSYEVLDHLKEHDYHELEKHERKVI